LEFFETSTPQFRSVDASSGNGRPITIQSQHAPGNGGFLNLVAGNCTSSGTGGDVNLSAGDGLGGSPNGGNILIDAGQSSSGTGGSVYIASGSSPSGTAGDVFITASNGATDGVIRLRVTPTTEVMVLDGSTVDVKTQRIENVVNPVNPQDAATRNYVDGYVDNYLLLNGSRAMTGNLNLGNNDITNPGVNTFSTIYGAATDGNRGDILYRGETNWVRLSPSTDGYVLTTRGVGDDPEWYPAPGASGGEANTGSNLGTDGYGVYDSKSSVTLRFRNIAVVSNILTINYDATDHDIDIGVNQANIDHGSIGGLTDDDHTQYILVNGTRAFTGPVQGDTDLTLIAQDGYVTLNSDMDADGYDIINIDVATNDAEYSMGNQSTSITLDANNGNFQTFNLNGNITSVTMTPPLTGIGRFQVRIVQNASYTISGWPASVLWPGGGTAPTITTGATSEDIITFFWNGTNWYGIWGGDFS
jgi:hypothetical protein